MANNPYALDKIPGLDGSLAKNLRVGSTVILRHSFEQPGTFEMELLSVVPISVPSLTFGGVNYIATSTTQQVELNSPEKIVRTNVRLIDNRSILLDALVDSWESSTPIVNQKFFIENPNKSLNSATIDLFNRVCSNFRNIVLDVSAVTRLRPFFKPDSNLTYRQALTQLAFLNKQYIDFGKDITLRDLGGGTAITVVDKDVLADPGLQVSYNAPSNSELDTNGLPYVLDDLTLISELEGYYLEPLPEEIPTLLPNELVVSAEPELITRPRLAEFFDLAEREEPFFRAQFYSPNDLDPIELPEFKTSNELLKTPTVNLGLPEELEYVLQDKAFCQTYVTPGTFIIVDPNDPSGRSNTRLVSPDGSEFTVFIDKNTPYYYQGGPIRELIEQCFNPRGDVIFSIVEKMGAFPAIRTLNRLNGYYSLDFEGQATRVTLPYDPTYRDRYRLEPIREAPEFLPFEQSVTRHNYNIITLFDLPEPAMPGVELPENKFAFEKSIETITTTFSNIRSSVGLAIEENELEDLIATYNSTLLLLKTLRKFDGEEVPIAGTTEQVFIDYQTATVLSERDGLVDIIRTMAEKMRDGANIELKRFLFTFSSLADEEDFLFGLTNTTTQLRDTRGSTLALPPEEEFQALEQAEDESNFRKYLSINDSRYRIEDLRFRETQIRNKMELLIEKAAELLFVPNKAITTTRVTTNLARGSTLFPETGIEDANQIREGSEKKRLELQITFERAILKELLAGFNDHYKFATDRRNQQVSINMALFNEPRLLVLPTNPDAPRTPTQTLTSNFPPFGESILASLLIIKQLNIALNAAIREYSNFQNRDKPAFENLIDDEKECRQQSTNDLNRAAEIEEELLNLTESLVPIIEDIGENLREIADLDREIEKLNLQKTQKQTVDTYVLNLQKQLNTIALRANQDLPQFELDAILENDNLIIDEELANLAIEVTNLDTDIANLNINKSVIEIENQNLNQEILVVQANMTDLNTELQSALTRATCATLYSTNFTPFDASVLGTPPDPLANLVTQLTPTQPSPPLTVVDNQLTSLGTI